MTKESGGQEHDKFSSFMKKAGSLEFSPEIPDST